MNSDKQVKVNGGSAISYHAFVEKLVKKFPRFNSIVHHGPHASHTNVILTIQEFRKLEEAFNAMAEKLEFCHLALGMVTEAAETADIIKNYAIYGKEFDRKAMVKEMGDQRFWMQDAQNKLMISDHEIAQGNADKLSERYMKMEYSDKDAIARVDKKFYVASSVSEAAGGTHHSGPFEHEYEAAMALEYIQSSWPEEVIAKGLKIVEVPVKK